MNIRYADLNPSQSGAKEFVMRSRRPTWQWLSLVMVVTLVVTMFLSGADLSKTSYFAILFLIIAGLGTYVVLVLQRSRDIVLATEFQNALFASALGFSNKFCLIVKNDGTIVYLDGSFQDMFPNFHKESRRAVDVLLEHGNVSKEQRKLIFQAIERSVFDRVIFDIIDTKGQSHKIVMSVEPIVRPSGFILLRGREFIEQRGSSKIITDTNNKKSSLINKSNLSLFSHVMDMMNLGLYMTSPTGSLTYANPLLEQWLGYEEGEISSRNLGLRDIISQSADFTIVEPANFEGDVLLQRKIGGYVKTFINQKTLYDDAGEVIGFAGLVHHLGEQNSEDKKKLW